MRPNLPVPARIRTTSPLAFRHLRPFLNRLLVSGEIRRVASLRRVADLLALSPDHRSSPLISRPLARLYFHLFPSSTTFLYNLLIRAFSGSQRHPGESLFSFVSLLLSSSLPDRFTFPFLAKAACGLPSPAEGTQIHSQVIRRGFESDIYVLNTLLSMYSTFKDMISAQRLFDSSSRSVDIVSWNTIIDGHIKVGDLEAARRLFDGMPAKNEVSWSSIISGYAGRGELDVARSLFDKMPVRGNVVTWNSMVSGFARQGLLPVARKMFDDMPARNVVSWNSMVSGYALNGLMDAARELFDQMPERDVVSWSCMISGYVQSNRFAEALHLFKEMQIDNLIKPNEVTMVSVLSACAHLVALEQGKWVHAYIDKNHMPLDNEHNLGAALIDMYAKCGSIETALKVFESLHRHNVSSWNALITGLAVNGLARESLHAFQQMLRYGLKPNDVTFLGVLMACVHGGLVCEGRQYFQRMRTAYGIQPEIKHYGCLVDLLGRAGLLEEAEGVVRSMPMKPDVMVLGALLGACRIHRDVAVADRVKSDVLQLKAQQSGCHVLLSNIFAAAGRWADAFEMRNSLKKTGIKKLPGSSSVELNGIVC